MILIKANLVIVLCFFSVAIYNFIELNVLILSIFRSRKSLYFWSLVVATWGIAINSVGYLLKNLELSSQAHLYATLILIGWCSMITGQSVVLYSRLHLVMHNKTRLRAILIMIITNALWLHLPVIVLVYGANSNNPKPFEKPYSIYEKIQLTVFFAQELIISGFYVWETTKLLKLERMIGNSGKVGVMTHLISVNVLVILLDFTILGLEFADLYQIQTAWKPLVYSIKLKMEFSILNRLVELTRKVRSDHGQSYSHGARQDKGVALGTLNKTGQRSVLRDVGDPTHYEVHVGGGAENNTYLHKDTSVLKTTEFHIQSHSRRRASIGESITEILAESKTHDERGIERGSASSVTSDGRPTRYENQTWK